MPQPHKDQSSATTLTAALPQADVYHQLFLSHQRLRVLHNECFHLLTFIVPPMCHVQGPARRQLIPTVPPPCSHCRINSASRWCPRAHQSHRQHIQAGRGGRGGAGQGHGVLCSAGYSTTSPYSFLLRGSAALPLSSGLGGLPARGRTTSLDPQLSWCVCQGQAENHSGRSRYQWEKAPSSCGSYPAAPPALSTSQRVGVFTASPHPLSSACSSNQAPHAGSHQCTEAQQQAEASIPPPAASPAQVPAA